MTLSKCLMKAGPAFDAVERQELLGSVETQMKAGVDRPAAEMRAIAAAIEALKVERNRVLSTAANQLGVELQQPTAVRASRANSRGAAPAPKGRPATMDIILKANAERRALAEAERATRQREMEERRDHAENLLRSHKTFGKLFTRMIDSGKMMVVHSKDIDSFRDHGWVLLEATNGTASYGLYNPKTKEIIIWADRSADADMVPLGLHEMLHVSQQYAEATGDKAVAFLLGQRRAELARLLDGLRKYGRPETRKALEQAWASFSEAHSGDTDINLLEDEWLAYAYQLLSDANEKGELRTWTQKVSDAVWDTVRGAARRMGVDFGDAVGTSEFLRLMNYAVTKKSVADWVELADDTLDGGVMTSFAGPNAAEANGGHDQMLDAIARITAGEDPNTVRRETGWFINRYDNLPRFEINDKDAYWLAPFQSLPESRIFAAAQAVKLGDVLKHDRLFEAYPAARDILVVKRKGFFDFGQGLQGSFDGANTITITPYAKNPFSTMLHEVQHWIQIQEGFALGGNEQMAIGAISDEKKAELAQQELERLKERSERYANEAKVYLKAIAAHKKYKDEFAEISRMKEELDRLPQGFTREEFEPRMELRARIEDLENRISTELFGVTKAKAGTDEWDVLYWAKVEQEEPGSGEGRVKRVKDSLVRNQQQIAAIRSGDPDALKKALINSGAAYRAYRAIAGEIEARNTQARLEYDDAERQQNDPNAFSDVEDLQDDEVLVTFELADSKLIRRSAANSLASARRAALAPFDYSTGRRQALALGRARVNLSAATSPENADRIGQLTARASQGDARAAEELNALVDQWLRERFDLAMPKYAILNFSTATGLYGGYTEPSITFDVEFPETSREEFVYAIRDARNEFSQQQVHVREPATAEDWAMEGGRVAADNSRVVPVFRFALTRALARDEVQSAIDESGLAGVTFSDEFVEIYYAEDVSDEANIQQFAAGAERLGAALQRLQASDGQIGKSFSRLRVYGSGDWGGPFAQEPVGESPAVSRNRDLLRGQEERERADARARDAAVERRRVISGDGRGGEFDSAPRYGTPIKGAIETVGIHVSNEQRDVVDSSYYGNPSGYSGEERARVMAAKDERLRQRIYFYTPADDGVIAEIPWRHAHRAVLRNIYDASTDPLNLRQKGRERARLTGEDAASEFESLVLNRGFDGYYDAKAFTVRGKTTAATVLLGRHSVPVQHVGDKTEGSIRASRAAPNTPAFKRWFGNSKVVDENGQPLVVYHATAQDFTAFQEGRDFGMHFGTAAQARSVAANKNPDYMPKTMPVYLRAEKLLRLRDPGRWFADDMARQLLGHPEFSQAEIDEVIQANKYQRFLFEGRDALKALLERKGYDGIVYLNRGEGLEGVDEKALSEARTEEDYRRLGAQDSYIVWKPTQIKSATGNTGAYDPGNPDIRYSRAKPSAFSSLPKFDSAKQDFLPDLPYDELAIALFDGGRVTSNTNTKADLVGGFFDRRHGPSKSMEDPEAIAAAVAQGVREAMFMLGRPKNGKDWYEEDIVEAFRVTSQIIPSLKRSPARRMLFTIFAALQSPGTVARENWLYAAETFMHWEETGTIPDRNPKTGKLWIGGSQSVNKAQHLRLLDAMVKEMGWRKTTEWLFSEHTVADLNDIRVRLGGYAPKSKVKGKATSTRLGLFVFGEKVGPFALNLNGIHEITVDQWMTKTFNRWFGRKLDGNGKLRKAPTEPERRVIKEILTQIGQRLDLKPYQVQSVLWFFEQGVYRSLGVNAKSYSFSDGARRFADVRRGGPATVGGQQDGGGGVQAAARPAGRRGARGGDVRASRYAGEPTAEQREAARLTWLELAKSPDLFQFTSSSSSDLKEVFARVDPTITVDGPEPVVDGSETYFLERDEGAAIRDGRVHVFPDGKVEVDLSGWGKGARGSAVYAAVANWALNTDRVFEGDRAGISGDGMVRRLENMISAVLKAQGTTRHVAPHPEMLRVFGMGWRPGDDAYNLEELLATSYNVIRNGRINRGSLGEEDFEFYADPNDGLKALDDIQWDPATKSFYELVNGRKFPYTDADFDALAKTPAASAINAGRATLKRAVLTKGLVRGAGLGERGSVLGRAGGVERGYGAGDDGSGQPVADRPVAGSQTERILYSRGNANSIPRNPNKDLEPSGFFEALWDSNSPGRLGFLSRQQLAEAAPKELTAVRSFLNEATQMDADRNQFLSDAGRTLAEWHRWAGKNREQNKKLSRLMHDTTVVGYDPSATGPYKPLITEAEFLRKRGLLNRKLATATSDEQKAAAKAELKALDDLLLEEKARKRAKPDLDARWAALPAEAKTLFTTVRDTYKKNRDALYRELKMRIERTEASGQVREAMLNKLRLAFEQNTVRGPYFPLMRFGQYWVVARNKATGEMVEFQMFEDKEQMKLYAQDVEKKGLDAQVGWKGDYRGEWEQVDPEFAATVTDLIRDSDGIDKQMRFDLANQVWQLYLQSLPDLTIRKQFIQRKKVKGWNEDAMRAFGRIALHNAHHLAKMRHGDALNAFVNEAEKQARDAADPALAQQYVQELRHFRDWAMNPTSHPVAQFLTSLGFVWYLGVSPAAAMVNLFQVPAVTMPHLAARKGVGYKMASSELNRAAAEFAGVVRTNVSKRVRDRAVFLDPDQKVHLDSLLRDGPNGQPGELAAYKELVRRGWFDKTFAHDLAGIAEEGFDAQESALLSVIHTKAPKALKPVTGAVKDTVDSAKMRMWMDRIGASFHNAEVFNREVTGMAAYRIARKMGDSHAEAVEYAQEAIRVTHFDYTNANRARFLRSPVAKVVLQFKQYAFNMLWRLFRDGLVGYKVVKKGLTADEAREAKARFHGMAGIAIIVGGLNGFFAWSALQALINMLAKALGDDEPYEFESDVNAMLVEQFSKVVGLEAAKDLADVVMYGPLDKATGATIGSRITPDIWRLLVPETRNDAEGREAWANTLMAALGPTVGGMGGSFMEAGKLASEGEYQRAVEAMSPKFVKDSLKAVRFMTEGVRTLTRSEDVLLETSGWEELVQFMGFTPAELTRRYAKANAWFTKEKQLQDRHTALLDQVSKDVIREGALSEDTVRKIVEFNQTMARLQRPDKVITGDTVSNSLQATRNRAQNVVDGIAVPDDARAYYEKQFNY